MKKQSGFTAGGFAQPKIRQGDKWRDKSGGIIFVTGYAFNRVTYVREGYEHPCIFPAERFLNEFTRMEMQTFTDWRAAVNPLGKIQKLRALIAASRERTQ